MKGRFEYVEYDSISAVTQKAGKELAIKLEAFIESSIIDPATKQEALNKLEECYMWIGKGVRNDQIARNGVMEQTRPILTIAEQARLLNKLMPTERKYDDKPFAFKHTETGEIVYRATRFGANGVYKREKSADKIL